MKEEWRDVVGYEGYYQVSNLGDTRSVDRIVDHPRSGKLKLKGRPLKKRLVKGYWCVTLTKNGQPKNKRLNRLVAKAFIENPNNYPFVNHKDGIKTNDHVDNLEWCTHQQNVDHAISLGNYNLGERHGMSKLREKDVLKIRKLYKAGTKQTELAKLYKISQPNISDIVGGKIWTRV